MAGNAYGAWADGEAAANTAGGEVLRQWGSKVGMSENVSQPATSGGTMKSFDGNTSFQMDLSCPSSNAFLSVLYGVGGGEISPLYVDQDMDFDAIIEQRFTSPVAVSGVCDNGIISCSAGTWTNCSYYTWTADANGYVSLASGSIYDLAGCSCINNSCGANLAVTAAEDILHKLGDGAVNAVRSKKPGMSVSSATVTGTSIEYFGLNPEGCDANSGGSLGASVGYYNPTDSTSLDIASSDAQSGTWYSTISSSVAASASTGSYVSCSVENIFTASTQDYQVTGSGAGTVCVEQDLLARIRTVDSTTYAIEINAPDYELGCANGWIALDTISVSGPVGNTSFSISVSGDCTFGNSINNQVDIAGGIGTCGSPSMRTLSYTYNYSISYQADTVSDYTNDECTPITAGCDLKSEEVDDVTTYRSFSPTGLLPVESCMAITTSLNTYNPCKSWWKADKVYYCPDNAEPYDLDTITERIVCVTESAADDSTTANLNYTDCTRDENGVLTYGANSTLLPNASDPPDCELWCKVKVPKTATEAALSGNQSQYQVDNSTYEEAYRLCGVDVACPYSPADGEILVVDCSCLDNFSSAAVALSAIDEMAKDLLCSSGTLQPPP